MKREGLEEGYTKKKKEHICICGRGDLYDTRSRPWNADEVDEKGKEDM